MELLKYLRARAEGRNQKWSKFCFDTSRFLLSQSTSAGSSMTSMHAFNNKYKRCSYNIIVRSSWTIFNPLPNSSIMWKNRLLQSWKPNSHSCQSKSHNQCGWLYSLRISLYWKYRFSQIRTATVSSYLRSLLTSTIWLIVIYGYAIYFSVLMKLPVSFSLHSSSADARIWNRENIIAFFVLSVCTVTLRTTCYETDNRKQVHVLSKAVQYYIA